ncbi:MAG: class I SAM-dependent methyltransferase [Rhodobacteraceae bacterium]|nr:class I SAM-dependent methyltransferase [Paracoccaceae bacterium]
MGFYDKRILPWVITKTCASKPIRKQREKVVPLAQGRVLEIGAGGGLNLPYYSRTQVEMVLGLDVSPELLDAAEKKAQKALVPFEGVLMDAASIPLAENAVDTVLVTYSLCSIDDLSSALSEMHRVLKPSGKLIFCEHGSAPDQSVMRVQNALTPLWKYFAGGCHLDRDLPEEIRKAGFDIEWMDQMYLPGTWRAVGWNSWGVAHCT